MRSLYINGHLFSIAALRHVILTTILKCNCNQTILSCGNSSRRSVLLAYLRLAGINADAGVLDHYEAHAFFTKIRHICC